MKVGSKIGEGKRSFHVLVGVVADIQADRPGCNPESSRPDRTLHRLWRTLARQETR